MYVYIRIIVRKISSAKSQQPLYFRSFFAQIPYSYSTFVQFYGHHRAKKKNWELEPNAENKAADNSEWDECNKLVWNENLKMVKWDGKSLLIRIKWWAKLIGRWTFRFIKFDDRWSCSLSLLFFFFFWLLFIPFDVRDADQNKRKRERNGDSNCAGDFIRNFFLICCCCFYYTIISCYCYSACSGQ